MQLRNYEDALFISMVVPIVDKIRHMNFVPKFDDMEIVILISYTGGMCEIKLMVKLF